MGTGNSDQLNIAKFSLLNLYISTSRSPQFARYLERRFPELQGRITGGNYPPPTYAIVAMQMAGVLQMTVIAFMFCGKWIFANAKIGEPQIGCVENEERLVYVCASSKTQTKCIAR